MKPSLRCSRRRAEDAARRRPESRASVVGPARGLALAWGLSLGCGAGSSTAERPQKAEAKPSASAAPEADAKAEPPSDDALADRYLAIRDALDADPPPSAAVLDALQADLKEIANTARDAHLRANASLLLGSVLEGKGDRTGAIGHYRHASKLVPDDAGPHMALARALAASGDYAGALTTQQTATDLDPDNLENWLALGELSLRTGDEARAKQAYVDYERRRKGLIDGLTLKNKGGEYLVSEEERIACAEALAAASDSGTAVALLYALMHDESPKVRATVATVMGIQRLRGFADPLTAHAKTEADPDVREAVQWALGEIARDPVDVEPGPRAALHPSDPRSHAEARGDAPKPE